MFDISKYVIMELDVIIIESSVSFLEEKIERSVISWNNHELKGSL